MWNGKKEYIGDGVYVERDGRNLILTTENGVYVSNTIVLEPEVMSNLIVLTSGIPRTTEQGVSGRDDAAKSRHDAMREALHTISLGKHAPSCPIAQKIGKGYKDCDCVVGVAYNALVADANAADAADAAPDTRTGEGWTPEQFERLYPELSEEQRAKILSDSVVAPAPKE